MSKNQLMSIIFHFDKCIKRRNDALGSGQKKMSDIFTRVQRQRVETSAKPDDCVDDFEGADALASEK